MRSKLYILVLSILLLAGLSIAETTMKLERVQQMKASDLDVLSAVWSPDGSMLALTQANSRGIYLMDAVSGQVETITEEVAAGYRFAWSADGRQIAYKATVDPAAALKAVKLVDLRTGQITPLSQQSTDVGVPSLLPDGRFGFTFEGAFLIVDAEGRVLETIPDIASNVATVSHDGQWILYNDRQDRIWAHHLTDGERFQATPDGRRFFNPVWSPTEPVAIVNELGGSFHLLDLQGANLLPLDNGNHYVWSADGRSILYDVTEDDGYNITAADIYVINRDGTGRAALTATAQELEMYPSCSRTDRIAFSQPDGSVFTALMVAQ
ncbi:TolB family protein [Candidatus Zixiibacteriota bacterium]